MHYQLEDININIKTDAEEFVRSCDKFYEEEVRVAADLICERMHACPIVLLSGPSGSGKTTTSLKLEKELDSRGITTTAVALDKYFRTIDLETAPRTPDGKLDFESPECLDMELLNHHFHLLSEHKEITIPHFDFTRQSRSESRSKRLRLGKNEIAIFEGIHALSHSITEKNSEAFKLYVSARSSIYSGDVKVFRSTWMRMMRRIVRDNNFRGADAAFTLDLWPNIKRGEQLYILPYEDKADYKLNSTLPYEVGVLKRFALPLLKTVPEDTPLYGDICKIAEAFSLFEEIDVKYVPRNSLLREFIGGGIYKY